MQSWRLPRYTRRRNGKWSQEGKKWVDKGDDVVCRRWSKWRGGIDIVHKCRVRNIYFSSNLSIFQNVRHPSPPGRWHGLARRLQKGLRPQAGRVRPREVQTSPGALISHVCCLRISEFILFFSVRRPRVCLGGHVLHDRRHRRRPEEGRHSVGIGNVQDIRVPGELICHKIIAN